MKKNTFLTSTAVYGIMSLVLVSSVAAQTGAPTRSITSDDFASQRPSVSLGVSAGVGVRRAKASKATYKFARRGSTSRWGAKGKGVIRPVFQDASAKVTEIGVTIWKLRPALRADAGFRLPVRVSGALQMWTAERVTTDSPFRAGDRIRLAVESPVKGYLYVINSEIGADGSLGHPSLIFPESGNQENMIAPGMLVDIPDQREELPYFVMNPKKENYAGEAIAVVVSPVPLKIKTDKNGRIEDVENLDELIPLAETEVFSRTDARDKIYSKAESQATCGAKTRQLEREKSPVQPCGPASRSLTREEPLPQSIYRVKTASGKPAAAVIELRTAR
jgi:hypothetical protein